MVNMRFVHGILFLASLHGIQSLKICSFNVRTFGKAKAAKEGILDVLVKIISRCDLLLMMEIKDSRNQAFPTLMKRLNNQNNRNEYESIISERLGRLAYKEQYAFIYRPQMNYFQVFMNATLKLVPKNVNVHVPLGSMPSIFPLLNKDTAEIGNSIPKLLSVKRSYQYPDHQADVFAREPFVVWFSSRSAMVKDFVIIPQHTRPGSSVSEINALYDVYMEMKRRWRAKYFILMGDFNADCDYVRKKEWINIRLRNDTNFVWLIGDNNDTTVKESTHCAYDRIVLRGEKLIKAVIPNSVNIFNFKEAYGMTEAQALNVSDHFPVEVELQESHGFSYWLRSFRGWKG